MFKKITIRDVAKESGVSLGTVDRVLHNRGGVSKDKKEAVEQAVIKLNYKPSKVAQTLALHKRNIKIGVIYPEVEMSFWNQVRLGINQAEKDLTNLGVEIIVRPTAAYNVNQQIEAINDLKKQNVNGIAMIPYHSSKVNFLVDELYDINIPTVTFTSDMPNSKRICFIGLDNYRSGQLGAKLMELFLKGKGNIAVLGVHRDVLCIQSRISGFVQKMETEFPEFDIVGVYDITDYEDVDERVYREEVYDMTNKIIEEHPNINGIYVTNSLTSCVGQAVRDNAKQNSIAVIGHESTPEISELIEQGWIKATIYQDLPLEVNLSLKYLYEYLVNDKLPENKIINTKLNILIKENNQYSYFI